METHEYKVKSLEATAHEFVYTDALLPLGKIIEGVLINEDEVKEVREDNFNISYHIDDLEEVI